jgi:hypothetical protein
MGQPKVMELIDSHTGRMRCKVCGAEHYANIKPNSGGKYYYGCWQCNHGCRIEKGGKEIYGEFNRRMRIGTER